MDSKKNPKEIKESPSNITAVFVPIAIDRFVGSGDREQFLKCEDKSLILDCLFDFNNGYVVVHDNFLAAEKEVADRKPMMGKKGPKDWVIFELDLPRDFVVQQDQTRIDQFNLFSSYLHEAKTGEKELVLRRINDNEQALAKDKNFDIKICRDFKKTFIPGGPSPS